MVLRAAVELQGRVAPFPVRPRDRPLVGLLLVQRLWLWQRCTSWLLFPVQPAARQRLGAHHQRLGTKPARIVVYCCCCVTFVDTHIRHMKLLSIAHTMPGTHSP